MANSSRPQQNHNFEIGSGSKTAREEEKMTHVDTLIERYWTDPAGLDAVEIRELQFHIDECEDCRKLMNGYDYAKNLIDEVVNEMQPDDCFEEDPNIDMPGIDEHADEFIHSWLTSSHYMRLAWKVIMKALLEYGVEVETMHFPDDCCPEIKWKENAGGGGDAAQMGEIVIQCRGESCATVKIEPGKITMSCIETGPELYIEFYSVDGLTATLSPEGGETAQLDTADIQGVPVEICFKLKKTDVHSRLSA